MTNISRGGNKQLANRWENWRNAREALRDFLSKRLSFLNTSHLFSECTEFYHRVFAAVVPGEGEEGEPLGWLLLPALTPHWKKSWRWERWEESCRPGSIQQHSGDGRRAPHKSSLRFTETDSEQTRSESIRKAMPAWETTRIAPSAVTHRQGNRLITSCICLETVF